LVLFFRSDEVIRFMESDFMKGFSSMVAVAVDGVPKVGTAPSEADKTIAN